MLLLLVMMMNLMKTRTWDAATIKTITVKLIDFLFAFSVHLSRC